VQFFFPFSATKLGGDGGGGGGGSGKEIILINLFPLLKS
jgi:hypothetical protein